MTQLLISFIQANKCPVTVETHSFMKIKHDPQDPVTARGVFMLKADLPLTEICTSLSS